MAEILKTAMILCFFFCVMSIVQAKVWNLKDLQFAKHYLKEFHYISPVKDGNHDMKIALELFQRYMHLPVTGYLDENTIKEMKRPRCGFPDIEEDKDTASPSGRSKRFAVATAIWNKTSLTYKFVNYGDDMAATDYDLIIKKAFKIWSDPTVLSFSQVQQGNNADIKITFGRRTHGSCGYPFDGPGKVLAHAFYPNDGDLHFDDDEHFTDGTNSGTNLLAVAVHEIGHLIGIGHSSEKNSVMNPQYGGYDPNLSLHTDDINAAAYLYSGGKVKPQATQSTCADRSPYCPKYRDLCTLSEAKIKCPYTCNSCKTGGQVAKCDDKFSARRCKRYKMINRCYNPYIRPKCQRTCNFC